MPIEIRRKGISKFVRNAVAVPPTAPKADMIANPIEPQLHAPALAPINEPKNPPPDRLIPFAIKRMRYILRLMTIPDKAATITINPKLNIS